MSEHGADRPSAAPRQGGAGTFRDDDELDLRAVAATVLGNWPLVAAITAVVFTLALVYAFLSTPVYEADSLIQIQQQTAPLGNGSSSMASEVLSSLFPQGASTDAEIQIMTSRSVLLPVVRELHLDIGIDPPSVPVFGALFHSPVVPPLTIETLEVPPSWIDEDLSLRAGEDGAYVLYSPDGDPIVHGRVGEPESAMNGQVKVLVSAISAPPGRRFTVVRRSALEIVNNLQEDLSVAQQGTDTGIVQISLEGIYKLRTTRIVNAIANRYVAENAAVNALQAKKSLEFIQGQLPSLRKKMNAAQTALAKYQAKHNIVNVDSQTQAFIQQLANLETDLTQLAVARAGMQARYKPNFPGFSALDKQEQAIRGKISQIQSFLSNLPQEEQQYLSLQSDAQVYSQLYATLLAKAQDLSIAKAGTLGTARVVDSAVVPLKPVRPRKALVVIVGLLLGCVLGVAGAFLRNAIRGGIIDPNALEKEFGMPVYAVIPHSGHQEVRKRQKLAKKDGGKLVLLASEFPDDIAVEALRSLRTSLAFALGTSQRRVITFSGASPGAGKSFITANMAYILAASGSRVLALDADLRRGHLQRYFDVPYSVGLSELLSGQTTLDEATRSCQYIDNLWMITGGKYPPNPYELISSVAMANLIEEVGKKYDFVLIDVPPALAVADGIQVARFADANFLVLRAGFQSNEEVHFALSRIRNNDVSIMGFVLNNLTKRAAVTAASRFGYSYQYRYKKR